MCTNIKLHTKDNKWITGRTNEFSGAFAAEVLFLPRDYQMNKFNMNEKLGKSQLKYSILGLVSNNAKKLGFEFGRESFLDGMNEFGLSVSVLYFPVVFKWNIVKEKDVKADQFSGYNLTNFVLGNCKDAKEAREYIRKNKDNIVILDSKFPPQGIHFAIMDAMGDSFVVEPEEGEIRIKENPTGVMTNSPRLEWHQENLASYINLQPIDKVTNQKFTDKNENPYIKRSMGNGAMGLPGDWTATSRFVRATYLVKNANISKSEIEAVNQCFRILSTADIVEGTVVTEVPSEYMKNDILIKPDIKGNYITDITDNVFVKDLSNKIVYWKTIDNLAPRFTKMSDYLDSKELKFVPINDDNSINFQEVKLS